MSIAQREDELINEFSLFEDWMAKYEYIIELGADLPLISDAYKHEQYLVKGCQSQVWLHSEMQDGKVVFTADSDAVITKGIIALLVRVLSNSTPQEIINASLNFVTQLGLKEHLSPNRSNGLVAMIKQMKLDAVAYQAQQL